MLTIPYYAVWWRGVNVCQLQALYCDGGTRAPVEENNKELDESDLLQDSGSESDARSDSFETGYMARRLASSSASWMKGDASQTKREMKMLRMLVKYLEALEERIEQLESNKETKPATTAKIDELEKPSEETKPAVGTKSDELSVPGTGKTATVECVAAHTGRPLYPITCGDIGVMPGEVERNLENHFNLAQRWDSVVLLDEADVTANAIVQYGGVQGANLPCLNN